MKKLIFLPILMLALSPLFSHAEGAKDPIATFTKAFRTTDQTCCANRGMPAYFDYIYLKNAEETLTARVRCEGGGFFGGATLSVHVSKGSNFKMEGAQEYEKEFDSSSECDEAFEGLMSISPEAAFVMDWDI